EAGCIQGDLAREIARKCFHFDFGDRLLQCTASYIDITREIDRNVLAQLHVHVRRKEIDMKNVLTDRISLNLTDQHWLIATIPLQIENGGMAIGHEELVEITIIDGHT